MQNTPARNAFMLCTVTPNQHIQSRRRAAPMRETALRVLAAVSQQRVETLTDGGDNVRDGF